MQGGDACSRANRSLVAAGLLLLGLLGCVGTQLRGNRTEDGPPTILRGSSSVVGRPPSEPDRVGPNPSGTLSCAVCVVGQLARLELKSKVRHTLALAHIALAMALARALTRALALALALRNPNPNPNTTKMRHVVEPNLRAGHSIALLMVLSQVSPSPTPTS